MTQPQSLEDQILQQVLVIQALRLRIARMESIYTTPRTIRSTGQNGTTEDTRHQRDTIEEYGPITHVVSRIRKSTKRKMTEHD
jgi:hypothetical protein